jgi:hypothetical protein
VNAVRAGTWRAHAEEVAWLPCEAWGIANRQRRMNEYIFPYKARTVGIAFARACLALDIADVTFDNLRREGMIRLLEWGLTLAQVREHALCDTLETLQRCHAAARTISESSGARC